MTARERSIVLVSLGAIVFSTTTMRAEQAKPTPPSPTLPKPQQILTAANDVKVTVKYTGKGTVDAQHRLWVWLFTSPEIGPGSIPIAEQSLDKNGGVVTFPNLSEKEVYIAVAYDEKGGFGGSAPPPPGSPIAFHGTKTAKDKPAPVVPGAKGAVAVTFGDGQRMQ